MLMFRQHGLTLPELLVAISLTAILAAASVASFSEFIKNNRIISAANDLGGSLALARTQAINLNLNVIACKSADGASCTTSGDWSQGWIVFVDRNGDAVADADEILRSHPAVGGSLSIVGVSAAANKVSYSPSGQTAASRIDVCDDRTGDFGHKFCLGNTGRVRIYRNTACPATECPST